jgi:nitroimidazol reductase NimA-like FMN-containing flavoprotein (pyridoxamine 5'-phosphate oxidase superfamily)
VIHVRWVCDIRHRTASPLLAILFGNAGPNFVSLAFGVRESGNVSESDLFLRRKLSEFRTGRCGRCNMLLREMSRQECCDLLSRLGIGRLGCARNNQPYVIPIYFAYEPDRLYGFSTLGQKIEWMRANPLVCVEADEVLNHNNWESVVVLGRYEELPDKPEYAVLRLHAQSILEKRAMWWQTGYAASQSRHGKQPATPVFYCIHIEDISGHKAVPDAVETSLSVKHHATRTH